MARAVSDQNLTYLGATKLRNLEWALGEIITNQVPGSFIEAGVALGGSGIVIARHLDDAPNLERREFHGYDVFGMIPAPGEYDPPEVHERYAVIASGVSSGINGDVYYGYRADLLEQVKKSFAAFGVPIDGVRAHLHQGLFESTLHPTGPVALAHIDCDWYEPVLLTLKRIYPYLSQGGFVISDDYYTYDGARRAVDEFVHAHDDLDQLRNRGHHMIIRRR